jgi:hypothetical protein
MVVELGRRKAGQNYENPRLSTQLAKCAAMLPRVCTMLKRGTRTSEKKARKMIAIALLPPVGFAVTVLGLHPQSFLKTIDADGR